MEGAGCCACACMRRRRGRARARVLPRQLSRFVPLPRRSTPAPTMRVLEAVLEALAAEAGAHVEGAVGVGLDGHQHLGTAGAAAQRHSRQGAGSVA